MNGMRSAHWVVSLPVIYQHPPAGGDFCSRREDPLKGGKHWWLLEILRIGQHIKGL